MHAANHTFQYPKVTPVAPGAASASGAGQPSSPTGKGSSQPPRPQR